MRAVGHIAQGLLKQKTNVGEGIPNMLGKKVGISQFVQD